MTRDSLIEVIDRILSLCDERSLWIIYWFAINFAGRERTS